MRNMVKMVVLLAALSISLPAAALDAPQEASWTEQLWMLLAENLPSFEMDWEASTADEEPTGSTELGPMNDPDGIHSQEIETPGSELGPGNDPNG